MVDISVSLKLLVILGLLAAVAPAPGCAEQKRSPPESPAQTLDGALRPSALASGLKALPGARFQSVARFSVAPRGGTEDAVTTTTLLTLDKSGNWRLAETNDRDGGREVVLFGRELAVGLRHGKMIRRPAQEPEPTRTLEEAVGAPWAAWQTVRRFATAISASPRGGILKLGKSATAQPAPGPEAAVTPLGKWRETVEVDSLEGEAR